MARFEKNVMLDVAAIKLRLNEASKSGSLPNVTFREIPRGRLRSLPSLRFWLRARLAPSGGSGRTARAWRRWQSSWLTLAASG